MKEKTILFGVLNWGLGHASRSIPIIREFANDPNIKLIVVADGNALLMLKSEFPTLIFEQVPDINVRYNMGKCLPFFLLPTAIKLLRINKKEHQIIEELVQKHQADAVISDNRYGLWSSRTKNIILTHQLSVLPPPFFAFFSGFLNVFFKRKLAPFNQVWVPDTNKGEGLAGMLSHQLKAHPDITYIGLLSRYQIEPVETKSTKNIAVVISGPMPFRKQLATKMIQVADEFRLKMDIYYANIPDLEGGKFSILHQNCAFQELNQALNQAEIVVGSGGYTTIMDVLRLNKKAILIPTPGQTEQTYLAKFNHDKPQFRFVAMDKMDTLLTEIEELRLQEVSENQDVLMCDFELYKSVVVRFKNELFENC